MTHEFNNEVLDAILSNISIPKMCRVRQHFPDEHIKNVAVHTYESLKLSGLKEKIVPGMSIAITAGSRGIDSMEIVLREVATYLKDMGAKPFIFPSMGSHGGATAEGQRKLLARYGITEEFCGCPIRSCMEATSIGKTEDGVNVFIDRFAQEADGVIAVNRIKPHVAFRGNYESGLVKMLTVGMGKQVGADALHKDGYENFSVRMSEYGKVVFDKMNILCGVAIVENAFDKARNIKVVLGEDIMEREPELLKQAFENMPKILLPETDVLVVNEFGKNFSGVGMDPNVTGRWPTPYASGGLECQRIAVLRLSELTGGNFVGLGLADMVTKEVYNSLSFAETYPNSMTTNTVSACKIPMVVGTEYQTILAAIKTCIEIDHSKVRVIMIKNTLTLDEIFVSENLLDEVKDMRNMEIIDAPKPLSFDSEGRIESWF